MPSGGSAKELHPPWAKLSSLGPKGPWDDNIALGGCNSFALPPEGMQLPIANAILLKRYYYMNRASMTSEKSHTRKKI